MHEKEPCTPEKGWSESWVGSRVAPEVDEEEREKKNKQKTQLECKVVAMEKKNVASVMENPVGRYKKNWQLRRLHPEVQCRKWSWRAKPSGPQPCRLCQKRDFVFREDWQKHVDEEHGGVQRYRNALFALLATKPYVVKGQEWRAIVSNYAECYAKATVDWQNPSDRMRELAESSEGLPAEERWAPRPRSACVFYARRYWTEELTSCFLAGARCFMKSPARVVALLDWSVYHAQWPNIPAEELQASAVNLRVGIRLLLHSC